MTTRGLKDIEPLRVVFTKTLDLPLNSNLWDKKIGNTLVVYDASTANEKHLDRIPKWVDIEKLSSDNPKVLLYL